MSERRLRGLAASGGIAAGPAVLVGGAVQAPVSGGPDEERRALEALAAVAVDLGSAAKRLRNQGSRRRRESSRRTG